MMSTRCWPGKFTAVLRRLRYSHPEIRQLGSWEALVAAGEPFSPTQVSDLERAIEIAEKTSGLEFGAYVGSLPRGRTTAEALHAAMPNSANSVLVAVDPDASTVDIVTGHIARRWLDDSRCRLAVLTMGSRFSVGDIPAGIHDGIILLGDQAVHPRSLFTDEPA